MFIELLTDCGSQVICHNSSKIYPDFLSVNQLNLKIIFFYYMHLIKIQF